LPGNIRNGRAGDLQFHGLISWGNRRLYGRRKQGKRKRWRRPTRERGLSVAAVVIRTMIHGSGLFGRSTGLFC
jgi:hypothetical protein